MRNYGREMRRLAVVMENQRQGSNAPSGGSDKRPTMGNYAPHGGGDGVLKTGNAPPGGSDGELRTEAGKPRQEKGELPASHLARALHAAVSNPRFRRAVRTRDVKNHFRRAARPPPGNSRENFRQRELSRKYASLSIVRGNISRQRETKPSHRSSGESFNRSSIDDDEYTVDNIDDVSYGLIRFERISKRSTGQTVRYPSRTACIDGNVGLYGVLVSSALHEVMTRNASRH